MDSGISETSATARFASAQTQLLLHTSLQTIMDRMNLGILSTAKVAPAQTQLLLRMPFGIMDRGEFGF